MNMVVVFSKIFTSKTYVFATLSKNKAIVVYKCILLMSFNIQACFDLYLINGPQFYV